MGYSFTTNRGRGCALAAKYGGWLDKNGNPSTYPVHGKIYLVLVQALNSPIVDPRDVKTCGQSGVVLTPQVNGYAPIALDRNLTTFVPAISDVEDEATVDFPDVSWIPSGGDIVGAYVAECDGNPFSVPAGDVNVLTLWQLEDADGIVGPQTVSPGDIFGVRDLVFGVVKPSGES